MSEKYAKEMILVPKPPEGSTTQAGGQGADEGMAQFWKRRLLVHELAHAPHVDKMMKIMEDMKESEGRALPPSAPDYARIEKARQRMAIVDRNIDEIKAQDSELDGLEWGRPDKDKQNTYGEDDESLWRQNRRATLQQRQIQRYHQLERMFPQPGMPPPPPWSPRSKDRVSTHPPLAGSFREAVERDETMEREFEGFRARAQEALTKAEKQGDPKAIKKAQQKRAIVDRNIEAIKDQDEQIDQLLIPRTKKHDEMTYGEEDATQRRQETLESLHDRRDKLYHQLEKLFPPPRIKPAQ